MKHSKVLSLLVVLVMVLSIFVSGCGAQKSGTDNKTKENTTQGSKDKKITIGFSMDTLMIERWQRDKETFTQVANELGADAKY